MKRRLVSLFLSLVMLLTLLPVAAVAEEDGSAEPKETVVAQESTEADLAEKEEKEEEATPTPGSGGSSEKENDDPDAAEYQIEEIGFRYATMTIGGPQDRTEREGGGYCYNMEQFKQEYPARLFFYNREAFYGTLAAFEQKSGISVSFESDQDECVWKNGENHSFTIVLTKDGSTVYEQELNVKIFDNDVTDVSVPEPILLVEGNDAFFDVTYDPATNEEECSYTTYRFDLSYVGQKEWVITKQGEEPETYTVSKLYGEFDESPSDVEGEYQTADTRWKAGEEHTLSVEFLGKIYSVPVKVIKPRYELVDFEYIGDPVALLEGINVGWPDGRYILPDVAYQVTYMYNGTKITESLRGEEIYELFDNRVGLTYMHTQVDPSVHWLVGEKHYFYVNLLGKMTTVPVTIVASPLGTLAPEEPDHSVVIPVDITTLIKYELAGCYDYISWDVPRFVLTMNEGQTYNGQSQLTGTLAELAAQLDVSVDESLTLDDIEDCEDNISDWKIGEVHSVKLTFCGLSCEVSIKRDGGPIDSITWSQENSDDMIVTLIEGYNAAACRNGEFAYNPLWRDKGALFEIKFNTDGMKEYGLDQDTYIWTLDQLYEETGLDVLTDIDGQYGNLAPDEAGLSYFYFYLAKFEDGYFTKYPAICCKTPFKLVEYTGTPYVTKVEYGDTEPLRLIEGADGYKLWTGDDTSVFIYAAIGAMNTGRFRLKVTLSDGTEFIGTPDDVGYFLYREIGTYYFTLEDSGVQLDQEKQPWQVGSDGHKLRIYLCGIPCDIPVVLAEGVRQALTEEDFPDEKFCTYLKEAYGDENGNILFENVWTIECVDKGITSLEGIEYFPNLTDLRCGSNDLTEIDLSGNPKVWTLWCEDNPNLTTLTFSDNTAMSALRISNTRIGEKGLDFSRMPELGSLVCVNSGFKEIDVSQNLWLYELNCAKNGLTVLDVSKNIYLEELDCSDNQITRLTLPGQQTPQPQRAKLLSALLALFSGESEDNETPVEESSAAVVKLKSLDCSKNQLTKLDAAACTRLESLRCTDNESSLKLNVATINDLALTAIGTNLSIEAEDGSANDGFALAGTLPASVGIGMRLTLSRTEAGKEMRYATAREGEKFRFEIVTPGTYKLTITSDDESLIPYEREVEIENNGQALDLPDAILSIRGDVNLDGVVDVYDLQRLYEHCSGIRELTGYAKVLSDVNKDGRTDRQDSILDMQRMYDLLTGNIKERVS